MTEIKNFFKRDRFAESIGIELLNISLGYAKAKIDIKPEHLNGFRAVQGGVLFTLADLAMAAASNANGQLAVSINASINYIKSAYGTTIYAEAREVSSNPKLASYEVTISNDKNEVIATLQGLIYQKKESLQDIIQKLPE